MNMRIIVTGAFLAICAVAVPAFAQAPAQPAAPRYVSVIGTVEKVDSAAKSLALKTDKGEESAIKYDDKTQFLRLPAGEKDTKKATRVSIGHIGRRSRHCAAAA